MLPRQSPDIEAAHEADETVIASTVSAAAAASAPGGSRPVPPRRSRRTSGTHERPDGLLDPQPFELVHRTSFRDEFARRRRGSSSSPVHAQNESALTTQQEAASDLSSPEDDAGQVDNASGADTTARESDAQMEEEESQLTPVKAEDIDNDMEESASPGRDGQAGGTTRSTRKGKRKAAQDLENDVSTPQQQKPGEVKRAGRKRTKRAKHRDGSPSEASSLSALSDGEEAALKAGLMRGRRSSATATRARTRKSQSVDAPEKDLENDDDGAGEEDQKGSDGEAVDDEAQDEEEAVESGDDTAEVDDADEDDASETGTEVEDTPYKSPKGTLVLHNLMSAAVDTCTPAAKKRKSSTGPPATSRSPTGRAATRANATTDAKKGKAQPQLREGKTRSVANAAQAESGHARKLSGAAANSVKKKQAKDVRKR